MTHAKSRCASRTKCELNSKLSTAMMGVRVAEWLSHSTVVQEVPGSNPGAAESVDL